MPNGEMSMSGVFRLVQSAEAPPVVYRMADPMFYSETPFVPPEMKLASRL